MELVKPITSDDDLIKLADKIGVRIDAIYDSPEITAPLPKRGSFIILMRTDGGVGHWVCVHDGHYFDSMGEGPPKRFGVGKYNIRERTMISVGSSLLFLYAKQQRMPQLMHGFNDLNLKII